MKRGVSPSVSCLRAKHRTFPRITPQSEVLVDKFDPCAILAQDSRFRELCNFHRSAHVKFPVVSSTRHKGKTFEIDSSKEMITLLGINGEPMGSLAWDFLVDQI